jgi:hypothetical protein
MNTATEPKLQASVAPPVRRDQQNVTRWIGANLHYGKRAQSILGAFSLHRLSLPSPALVASLALLLALTAACAWVGSKLPADNKIGPIYFQRMPNGDLVWTRYRGRVLDLDDLPQSGNSIGDEFMTYDGVLWLWVCPTGQTVPTWIDP